MRILLFSDIHGDLRAIAKLLAQPADIYIAAGDLSTFGRELDGCGEALGPLGEKLWLLPGNHETHAETRSLCARFGFVDFHRQIRTVESAAGKSCWAGLGYSNPTPFDTPGEYSEEEIAAALADLEKAQPRYAVIHFPPRGTRLDEFAPGQHAGSAALRTWIERAQPKMLFCGHIHEAAGRSERIGQTECVSLGKRGRMIEI